MRTEYLSSDRHCRPDRDGGSGRSPVPTVVSLPVMATPSSPVPVPSPRPGCPHRGGRRCRRFDVPWLPGRGYVRTGNVVERARGPSSTVLPPPALRTAHAGPGRGPATGSWRETAHRPCHPPRPANVRTPGVGAPQDGGGGRDEPCRRGWRTGQAPVPGHSGRGGRARNGGVKELKAGDGSISPAGKCRAPAGP